MKRLGFISGQRVDFKDGFIVVPPMPTIMKLAEPDVYAESEDPLYPIGTLAWFPGIGKKYRYSKAAQAIGTDYRFFLAAFGNYVPDGVDHENEHGFYGTLSKAYDAGVKEVNFTDTIDKAKDFYAGAYFMHFDAADQCKESGYIISGPPAAIEDPYSCTVKLLKATKYEYIALDKIEIWCNPYSNIRAGCVSADAYDGYETYAGVPSIQITSGYYFWLQTAGPCFITPNGWVELCPGYAANSRVVMAGPSAGNITREGAPGVGEGYQRIGELLCVTLSGSGSAFVNMDLDLGH